ncbi:MAG TPA: ferritin-like domain-containing protein [Gammaproteobacteria bacterium]|nr:ferritin-like domain-containing protein [Gammaproteobacteria bacterium]
MSSLFPLAHQCLAAADPDTKVALTHAAARAWQSGKAALAAAAPPQPVAEPGRPPRPKLVPPRELPRRRLSSPAGRAALIHAITHIEFNAINLAWDAVYRFRGLPREFYDGWVQVADEEARHFSLLRHRLRELGFDYGDLPAHDGLWQMAQDTAHDVLVRMALVPRVLEARGLDVTPGMMQRLREAGDTTTADILAIILREEVGHVAIGSRWFRWTCEQRGMEPESTFRALLQRHMKGRLKGPFSIDARLRAGFSREELAALAESAR